MDQLRPRLQPSHGLEEWDPKHFKTDHKRACIIIKTILNYQNDARMERMVSEQERAFLTHCRILERYAMGRETARRRKHKKPLPDDCRTSEEQEVTDSAFEEGTDEELGRIVSMQQM